MQQRRRQQALRVVRVDDTSKLPLDYLDANGSRVIGADFSAGAAGVAAAVRDGAGSGLHGERQRVDADGSRRRRRRARPMSTRHDRPCDGDGAAERRLGAQPVRRQRAMPTSPTRSTATGSSAGLPGASRSTAHRRGQYAARAVPGRRLARRRRPRRLHAGPAAEHGFASAAARLSELGAFRLAGIGRRPHRADDGLYRATSPPTATSDDETQQTDDARRWTSGSTAEYGVNVDEEMARLMELQNAYAANARVISVVQDLMNQAAGSVGLEHDRRSTVRCIRSRPSMNLIAKMQEQFDKLQAQLATGQKATNLAELGSSRYFDLSIRGAAERASSGYPEQHQDGEPAARRVRPGDDAARDDRSRRARPR